jgi:hypothetical protein
MKIFVAILLIAAVPAYAQAQSRSTAKVSKDDAQNVVTIISGDKAKTQAYCDIQKLGGEMEQAYEKRNLKLVDELLQKIDTMEKTSVLNMPHWSMDWSSSIPKKTSSVPRLCWNSLHSTCSVRGRPRRLG